MPGLEESLTPTSFRMLVRVRVVFLIRKGSTKDEEKGKKISQATPTTTVTRWKFADLFFINFKEVEYTLKNYSYAQVSQVLSPRTKDKPLRVPKSS